MNENQPNYGQGNYQQPNPYTQQPVRQNPYQQYQQQMYGQQAQYAPVQQPQPVPPSGRGVPVKLIGVVFGIVLVIISAIFLVGLLPEGEEVDETELIIEEMADVGPSIMFANNDLVFDDEILIPRDTSIYDVGEEIYLLSVFKGFEQEETSEGQYKVELSYGVELSQPEYNIRYDDLSDPNLAILRKSFDVRIDDYYFTAVIPTNSLAEGFYTAKVTGKDKITGQSVTQDLSFELHEPFQLKVSALYLGDFDSVEEVFVPKTILYRQGEMMQAFFEIRGFDVNNNTPDVIVDLFITDGIGNILHDVSQTSVYRNNITYLTPPVLMAANLDIPLTDVTPGNYNLQILGKDGLARISSLKKVPFTVRE